jgi:hypothetical protein
MGGSGSGRPHDDARDAQLAELRRQGLTLAEIGRRFGITRQAVKVALDRLGVPKPAVTRPVGFARLTPEQRHAVAVRGGRAAAASPKHHRLTPDERKLGSHLGGKAAQAKGTGHRFTVAEARAGGRKGGLARRAKRKRG